MGFSEGMLESEFEALMTPHAMIDGTSANLDIVPLAGYDKWLAISAAIEGRSTSVRIAHHRR